MAHDSYINVTLHVSEAFNSITTAAGVVHVHFLCCASAGLDGLLRATVIDGTTQYELEGERSTRTVDVDRQVADYSGKRNLQEASLEVERPLPARAQA